MRKKIFVAMMIGCMILGGCRGSGDSTATTDSDNYEAEYDAEDDVLDASDGLAGEDYASDEDVESEEDETEVGTEAVEMRGIIAMIRQTKVSASGGYTDVQIISINPETGAQNVISEFHLDHITYAELQRAEEIDNDTEFYYAQPETFSVYGNNRDWFSDDFTKMKADRTYANNNNEFHAGWVDSDGTFFDVTEAIGAVEEENFSSHTAAQRSKGFVDGKFAFHEYDNTKDYYVSMDDVSSSGLYEAGKDDWYSGLFRRKYNEKLPPTYRIDDNTCIMDIATSGASCPNSVIVDIGSEEIKQYLPDSERYNWSGIMNPGGDTIAFLSTKHGGNEAVELYTVPLVGGEPEKISVVPNGDLLVDITTLIGNNLPVIDSMYAQYCYALIGWK